MSSPSNARRLACALLAVIATACVQSVWLQGLDRDAAGVIASARA